MSLIYPSLNSGRKLNQFIRQQKFVMSNEQIRTGSHHCTSQSVDSVAFYTAKDWELKMPLHITQKIPNFLV